MAQAQSYGYHSSYTNRPSPYQPLYPARVQGKAPLEAAASQPAVTAPQSYNQPTTIALGAQPYPISTAASAKSVTVPVPTPVAEQAVQQPELQKATVAPTIVDEGFTVGGNIEAGANFSTGNTESREANIAGVLKLNSLSWENTLKGRLEFTEENNITTEEEYRAGLKSKYILSPQDFVFGELDYVDDRFSGFDFRASEVLGYGRKWYNEEEFKWSSSVGAGLQQTRAIDGETENSPLGRVQNDLEWTINEYLAFENLLRADISEVSELRTESALKTNVAEQIYLKFGVNTTYLSDVPENTNELDIDSYVNLSYEY